MTSSFLICQSNPCNNFLLFLSWMECFMCSSFMSCHWESTLWQFIVWCEWCQHQVKVVAFFLVLPSSFFLCQESICVQKTSQQCTTLLPLAKRFAFHPSHLKWMFFCFVFQIAKLDNGGSWSSWAMSMCKADWWRIQAKPLQAVIAPQHHNSAFECWSCNNCASCWVSNQKRGNIWSQGPLLISVLKAECLHQLTPASNNFVAWHNRPKMMAKADRCNCSGGSSGACETQLIKSSSHNSLLWQKPWLTFSDTFQGLGTCCQRFQWDNLAQCCNLSLQSHDCSNPAPSTKTGFSDWGFFFCHVQLTKC